VCSLSRLGLPREETGDNDLTAGVSDLRRTAGSSDKLGVRVLTVVEVYGGGGELRPTTVWRTSCLANVTVRGMFSAARVSEAAMWRRTSSLYNLKTFKYSA